MSQQLPSPGIPTLVGRVTSLRCYPIKSCGAVSGDAATGKRSGLEINTAKDRYFMIVKENGDFITQRQNAKMASIRTSVEGDELVLQSDLMSSSCRVPLVPKADNEKTMSCRVWKDRLDGHDCGDVVADWLSKCINEPGLRLVASLPNMKRREISHPDAPALTEVAYPDSAPLLVVNTASLSDLKSKIPGSEKISVTNFRPNIVVETTVPWDEDEWSTLRIGDNCHLNVLDHCSRCVLTTVDHELCERRKDGEPLKTLKTFRMFPSINKTAPMFGLFVCFASDAELKVGDPVYVTRKA